MDRLLSARQILRKWFAEHDLYLMTAIKFLLMMTILLVLNWHLGYRYDLMRWVLVILASLVSCLLPWSGMTAVAALYTLGHVSALSWEASVILGALFFIAILFHYLFLPGGSFLIVLVCLSFYAQIPYLIPILVGLFGSVLSFIPVTIGVGIYYTLLCLEKNAVYLLDPGHSIEECFFQILNSLRDNQEMILTLVIFCLVTLAVYGLSHRDLDYARYIAVATGGVLYMVLFLLGGFLLNVPVSYIGVLIGCVLCCALAVVAAFWEEVLDYSRPEFLQYEDDEYVYYVKALPKVDLTRPEREVKEINAKGEGEKRAQPEE